MTNMILKRLSIPFFISCVIGLIYNIVSIVMVSSSSAITYRIELWNNANDLLNFIYPVFCTIPFCWILYYERKNGYLTFVHPRIQMKKYLFSHYLCGGLLSFLCMFFISFSGLFIALYVVEPVHFIERNDFARNLFGEFQILKPLLYGLLLSIWRGVIAVLLYSFSFIVSLFSKHLFVILTGAFLYTIIENFVTAILGYPIISLCTSFQPNRMNFNAFHFPAEIALLIGPIILIIVILSFYLIHFMKGRENGTICN